MINALMYVTVLKKLTVIINVNYRLEIAMTFALHVLNPILNMDVVHVMNLSSLENNMMYPILPV